MRQKSDNGVARALAIAGSHSVLLGIDAAPAAAQGLLGFAIERADLAAETSAWASGRLGFPGMTPSPDGFSQLECPLQQFQWVDPTVQPGRQYSYTVLPMYGKPGNLTQGKGTEVTVSTESGGGDVHAVNFNRALAASQTYAREFAGTTPAELLTPGNPAAHWLSGGLQEAMVGFVEQASGAGWSLRASLFEFTYPPLIQAFTDARNRGVDVGIVLHTKVSASGTPDPTTSENWSALKALGIDPRTCGFIFPRSAEGLSHNKFIVLLQNSAAQAVWTGSTNLTAGALYGQSNVGHAVNDSSIAAAYLDYWNQLRMNPAHAAICTWNQAQTPVPSDSPPDGKTLAIFSPRPDLTALNWYAKLMDGAASGVFLTAAFGVSKEFTGVLTDNKDTLRYLMMDSYGQSGNRQDTFALFKDQFDRIAIGETLKTNAITGWLPEQLTGLNQYVPFIHTKYLLVDPLSNDPIVVTGSANFSADSTTQNDENMLVVTGDMRVADIYLADFMRLFLHYRFRDAADHISGSFGDSETSLTPDDSWTKPFYVADSVEAKERSYFAGGS